MLYRLDISTFYLYEHIAFPDFLPWEDVKLGLLLSNTTFIVNSQADNHFWKHVSFFSSIIAILNQFLY